MRQSDRANELPLGLVSDRPGDAFDGSMILLDDVVEVLRLAHLDGQAAVLKISGLPYRVIASSTASVHNAVSIEIDRVRLAIQRRDSHAAHQRGHVFAPDREAFSSQQVAHEQCLSNPAATIRRKMRETMTAKKAG